MEVSSLHKAMVHNLFSFSFMKRKHRQLSKNSSLIAFWGFKGFYTHLKTTKRRGNRLKIHGIILEWYWVNVLSNGLVVPSPFVPLLDILVGKELNSVV